MTYAKHVGAFVGRGAIFALLWLVLTEGDLYAWWFGAVVVLGATTASVVLVPRIDVRITGLVAFLPFFCKQSLLGGLDVARRAFDPRLPLDPVFVDCPLELPRGPARVVLADTVSLLPGTVSVELTGESLRVHTIDRSLPTIATLRQLEGRIADIFTTEGTTPGTGRHASSERTGRRPPLTDDAR